MLDPHGFVATCNSTHFFIVAGDEVLDLRRPATASAGSPAPTCSRSAARTASRRARRRFSLTDVYGARRGVRHRHLRRRRAGAHRSTAARSATAAAGRWSSACRALYRELVDADVARARHDRSRSRRHVVRPAQHLHRDDARVGEPPRRASSSTSRCTRTTSRAPASIIPARDEVIASQPTDWHAASPACSAPLPAGPPRPLREAHGPPRARRDMDLRWIAALRATCC